MLRILAPATMCSGLVSRERLTTNRTVLDFFSGDATPLAESGSEQVSASIQCIATRRTLAAMPKSVAKEFFIVLKVRLAGELDRPVAGLGRRASRSSQRVPLQQGMYCFMGVVLCIFTGLSEVAASDEASVWVKALELPSV